MKKYAALRLLPALLVLSGLFLGRAHGADYPEVMVIAKSPYGVTREISASAAITATFNQPMVPLTSAEKAGTFCPAELFEIKDKLGGDYPGPADAVFENFKEFKPVKGRCRWQGTQALAFEPQEPLKTASLYAVKIPKGFKSENSGRELPEDEVWFFETPRPGVANSSPYNNQRWVAPDSTLFAAFTQPMDPVLARGFVELTGQDPDGESHIVPAGVRRATAEEVKKLWPYSYEITTATVLAVKPARLNKDYSYTLTFKQGLPAAEGALGLADTRAVNFKTYRTFKVTALPENKCLPAGFELGFSNPVRYGEFYKHLTVNPPVKFEMRSGDEGYDSGDEYGSHEYSGEDIVILYLPDIDFKPATHYSFTVSGELADIFGNKMGEDVKFEIDTMDYCPYFTTPSGFGVLEGYLPARHPAEAVNAGSVSVIKGRISEEEFIPFYNGGMKNEAVLKYLALKSWEPSANARNLRIRTFFDYSELIAPEGLLFARLTTEAGRSFSILDNVTRLGLTFKISSDSSFIWTTYLRTGKAAINIPVEIRDDGNKVLWSGVTDKNGFAAAPGWVKLGITDWARWSRPALWLFARPSAGGSAVINSSWSHGVEPWRFSINYDSYPRPRRYAAGVFTERGVYRPGETVNIKGVGRKLVSGDWEKLDIPIVQLSVTDSRGNRVLKATVPVSGIFSSFDYAYQLAEGAPTGIWTVEAAEPYADDKSTARAVEEDEEDGYRNYRGRERPFLFTETFRVEAFKPAVFEVKTQALKENFLAGETFRAAIEGWYLFGAPMAGSRADWNLRLAPGRYSPPGYEDFMFDSDESHRGFDGRLAGSGSAELDLQGKTGVEAVMPKDLPGSGAIRAALEAGVTDPERQRLFSRAGAWMHRANLYFGLKPSAGFLEAGRTWSAEIVAVRPEGAPAAGIQAGAKLVKRQWLSSRRAGLGGRLEWVSEVKDTVISSSTFTSTGSTETWTHTPAESGYYIFSVSGADEEGRASAASFSFYVVGPGDAWWAREDSDIIELTAEKKEYKPGDTARILVKAPYEEALALVTVEREGVMDHWSVPMKGGADFIKVPIKEKYLPNAYVGVILVKGRAAEQKFSEDGDSDLSKPQAKFGYVNLNVNPGGRRLKVSVKSAQPKYRPGEEAELEIISLDEKGRPVQAEATVFAVDEGVLALTGYGTPDLFAAFYGARALNVKTVDSRLHIIGQRSYGEKGEARGGGGGAALAGIDLRSNFVPTAYWNPSVKTDARGQARVSFKLPDNLTRFRLMAVASTGRLFGSGESSLTVSKPLMLRPSLPRLARPGDAFDCGAVLHNYSDAGSSVAVSMEALGGAVSVAGPNLRWVAVESGKAEEISWKCKAVLPGVTIFRFRAKAFPESDGLEWRLPVRENEPQEYAAMSGVTNGIAEETLLRPWPGAPGNLGLTLSASALSGLEEGARFLLEYPYGCLEQKLSRAMPVVTGSALIEEFRLGSLGTLKAETLKVFARLGDYQRSSGGFSYWTGYCREADPYLTAYALEASALAAKEGYVSDRAVINRAVAWLKSYLSNPKTDWAYPYSRSEDYAARAYAVYALALHGEQMTAYFNQLYSKRAQAPYLAQAYLLMAARLIGFDPKAAKTLASEIMNQGRYSPTLMHFEDAEPMPWIHNSSVKTTAVMLDALLTAEDGFPGDEKAVKWLTGERKAKGRWRTTQENSWALRAFQDFYRRYEKEVPNFTASVSKPGEGMLMLAQGKFAGRTLASVTANAGFEKVFGSEEKMKLIFSKSGTGRLYYTARMGFSPQKRDNPAAEGFEISREIKPMQGGLPPQAPAQAGPFKAGSRAIVTVTVKTSHDRTFVAVNDPVPAGFEVVNTAFAVESSNDAAALAQSGARGGWWGEFERSEQYDDRVLIFADYLTKGTHKYSYIVQATTPGTFYGPATLVEGMYEPEVFGRTASSEVTIER